MVKIAIFSSLAVFATVALSASVPADQAWQVVDTHTAQPDCLKATNRKCDVIDFSKITQDCSLLNQKFSSHAANLTNYDSAQFLVDTYLIADNWLTTAKMINASLPLDQIHDFYQRMAVADMIHWTQHLPLFTVFKSLIANKKQLKIPTTVMHAGILMISRSSDALARDAFNYLPTDPPIIRQQIGNLGAWLTAEFVDTLKEFPLF